MRKLIFLIIFPLLLSEQLSFATEWEIVSEMPIPVMGGQALVKDGLIYIIGGYTDSTYSVLNTIQAYDPELNTWSILTDTMTIPRYGLSAINYSNSSLIFGGNSGQDTINFSLEMWGFDGQPYFYSSDPNFGRNFATAQLYGDDLFIFGGQIYNLIDSLQSAYIVQYNMPSKTVTFISDTLFTEVLPLQQMSAFLNGKIYIFGGAYNGILNTIYRFDPATVAWEGEIMNMIEKRAGGAAVVVDYNKILVVGGYNEQNNALASSEILEISGSDNYNVNTYPPLNYDRTELMAAAVDSIIFVFGGKDIQGECVPHVEMNIYEESSTTINNINFVEPSAFLLKDNYPNPFNPKTTIGYQISFDGSSASHVRLSVHDILGKEVAVLIDEQQSSGEYVKEWDAGGFASGIYFYRLTTPAGLQTKSMLLIR